jgi:hypothetical protein
VGGALETELDVFEVEELELELELELEDGGGGDEVGCWEVEGGS